jgi:RNA polymerase sigma-70 factor (ECF subfamily)
MDQPELMGTAALPAARCSARVSGEHALALPEFDALYEEHFAAVWRLLQAMGVTRSSLDDAVQDVFLAAYRQLGTFEARSSIRTWLCGIACHVAANHRRREQRKGGLALLDQEAWAAVGPGPLEQLEQTRAWAIVRAFLDSLDERKRTTYALSRVEGLTAPEIAQALHIPLNTVYSRLHASEVALQQFLAANKIRENDNE